MGSFGAGSGKGNKKKKRAVDPYAKQKKTEDAKEQAKYEERRKELETIQAASERMEPDEFIKQYGARLDALGVEPPKLETHRGGEAPSTLSQAMSWLNTPSSMSVGWQTGALKEEDSTAKNVAKWLGRGLAAVGTLGASEVLGAVMPEGASPFGDIRQSYKNAIGAALHKEHYTGAEMLEKKMHMAPGIGTTVAGLGVDIATDPTTFLGVGSLTKGGKALKSVDKLSDTASTVKKAADLKAAVLPAKAVKDTDKLMDLVRVVDAAGGADDVARLRALKEAAEVSRGISKTPGVTRGVAKSTKNIGKTLDRATPLVERGIASGLDDPFKMASKWGQAATQGARPLMSFAGQPLVRGEKAMQGLQDVGRLLKGADIAAGSSRLVKAIGAPGRTMGEMFQSMPAVSRMKDVGGEAAQKIRGIVHGAKDAAAYESQKILAPFKSKLDDIAKRVKDSGDDVTEFWQRVSDKYEFSHYTYVDDSGARMMGAKTTTALEDEAIDTIENFMKERRAAEIAAGVDTKELSEVTDYANLIKRRPDGSIIATNELMDAIEAGKPMRYLPHRLTQEEIDILKSAGVKPKAVGQPFPKTRNVREGLSAMDAEQGGKYIQEANVASLKRGAESAMAIEKERMYSDLSKVLDDTGKPLVQKAADGSWLVNDALKSDIDRVMARMKDPNLVGQAYNKIMDIFRATATILNPGFHFRNWYSNWWNMYLGFGMEGLSPNRHHFTREVFKRLKAGADLDDLADIEWVSKTGRITTGKEFAEQAAKHGALDVGFMGLADEAVLKAGKMKYGPVTVGRKAGTRVEGHARLTAFLNGWMETGDWGEASNLMKKYLFDYGDLSPMEKQLRRVVPFWTWTRKNLPLQVENLIKQPGKYAGVGKVSRSMHEAAGLDETNTPGYFNNLFAAPLPGVKMQGVPQFINPNLPFQDLQKLPVPTNPLSKDSWGQALENTAGDTFGMVSPFIKAPIERLLNKEAFTGKEIYGTDFDKKQGNALINLLADAPGVGPVLQNLLGMEKVNAYYDPEQKVWGMSPGWDHALRQIPFLANMGKWTGAATGEVAPGKAPSDLLTTLLGIKLMPYDQETEKRRVGYENMNRLQDFIANQEQQRGVDIATMEQLQNFLKYQAGKPTMDIKDFAKANDMDSSKADTSIAYLDYLRGEAGHEGPMNPEEVQALDASLERKEAYMPSDENVERYLRIKAGEGAVYTFATWAKKNNKDEDAPDARNAYQKYLMREAGVDALDMDELAQLNLAYWLGEVALPKAKPATAPKKKKKKK
jgi:hypothetical protein